MFRSLPELTHEEADLFELADAIAHGDSEAKDGADAEESHIPSGYTYLGQFIDHDITFDPASSLQKANDPNGLIDYRTPRLDLDNVYGRGPDDQPYLYDGKKFVLGTLLTGAARNPNARDLARSNPLGGSARRAIIGDPRNDENVIVSQLQSTFLRFHNRLVDDNPGMSFEEIQTMVRWHYQYMVLNDFLPRIVSQQVIDRILPRRTNQPGDVQSLEPNLLFYHFKNDPYIPVEFSVAGYRMGHSMVRPGYRLNDNVLLPIFDRQNPAAGLNAFGEFNSAWAIDWHRFLQMDSRGETPTDRVQFAYKIDTSMVDPLKHLPKSVVGNDLGDASPLINLAARNLLRSQRLGLPSGEAVARFMGLQPLTPDQILIGKAIKNPSEEDKPMKISDIAGGRFNGKTPLWVYILAESARNFHLHGEAKLGDVGGQIVAEVFIGLLAGDPTSYLNVNPFWVPTVANPDNFGLAEFVSYAISGADAPISGSAVVTDSSMTPV